MRALLESLLLETDLDETARRRFVTAVDEACANVITHATRSRGEFPLRLQIQGDGDLLTVRIPAYCKSEEQHRVRPRPLDEIRPGGLGSHFMACGADAIRYEATADGMMDLCLTKALCGEPSK